MLYELAKQRLQFNFDVFNALTLLDNPLFLEQQKFGAGDGQLHYYLYNYRTGPIAGGVDAKNNVDASKRGGIGVVMVRQQIGVFDSMLISPALNPFLYLVEHISGVLLILHAVLTG